MINAQRKWRNGNDHENIMKRGNYIYDMCDALLASRLLHLGIPGFHLRDINFKMNGNKLFSATIRANFFERLRENEWEVCINRGVCGTFLVVLSIWRMRPVYKRIERRVKQRHSPLCNYNQLMRSIKSIIDEAERVL